MNKLIEKIIHEWECTKRFVKNLMGPGEIILSTFCFLLLIGIPLRIFLLNDIQFNTELSPHV